jgi:hypothetical protein
MNWIGSVSPAAAQVERRGGRLRSPARGQLQLHRAFRGRLRMNGHPHRQRRAVERQNPRLRAPCAHPIAGVTTSGS